MEETEIQSIYSNSRPSVVPSQEPAANALPFRAGVLTQRTGHFAQVIKHGSSQGSITGIVQKATDVGSCICGKKKKKSRERTIQAEIPQRVPSQFSICVPLEK